jgi:hypothetical protein
MLFPVSTLGDIKFYKTDIRASGEKNMTISYDLTLLDTKKKGTESYSSVWGDGTYIYTCCDGEGLRIYRFDGMHLIFLAEHYGAGTYSYRFNKATGSNLICPCAKNWGLYKYTFDGTTLTQSDNVIEGVSDYTGSWTDGNYVYTACNADGLRANRLATFTSLDVDATINPLRVWGYGNYIYVLCTNLPSRGLFVYTFNGTKLNKVAYINNTPPPESAFGSYQDVFSDGTYIYLVYLDSVVGTNKYIQVYTFDGTTLNQVSILTDSTNRFNSLWSDGTYVYVAARQNGLLVYRFDGSNFTQLIKKDDGNTYYGVWGDGNYVYASGDFGLRAYKLKKSLCMKLKGMISWSGR